MKKALSVKFQVLIVLLVALPLFQTNQVTAHPKEARLVPNAGGPVINVWYGLTQNFGSTGLPQRQVNILGNVSDPDGVASLTYSLNSGTQLPLSIGGDTRRLYNPGDFNVELFDPDLQNGSNTLVLNAKDSLDNTTNTTITVNYTRNNTWPLPYSVQWSDSLPILNQAQVVDGKWDLVSGGIRTEVIGYDRLIGIGDYAWQDYEVTVPVTIHAVDLVNGVNPISTNPGVGILLRWDGHTDDPVAGAQPKTGWFPFGTLAWYSYRQDATGDRLELYGNSYNMIASDTSGKKLSLNVTYNFKARVETVPGHGPYYSFKVWEKDTAEPVGWDLTGYGALGDPGHGSFLLFAHHADVTFGNVNVTPLGSAPATSTIISDDFNRCSLNSSLWTVIDPVGDALVGLDNIYTGNAALKIQLPAEVEHDIKFNANKATRIMQPANDTDFEVQAKFLSGLSQQYQMQGILVEEDGSRYLRYELHSDGVDTRMHVASYQDGVRTVLRDAAVAANGAAPLYLSVIRTGGRWIARYSLNGSSWTTFTTFPFALRVTQTGIYGGNAVGNTSPEQTMLADYFFNAAAPISTEDEGTNSLSLQGSPAAKGTVAANPNKSIYQCGETVTLTATPIAGWRFSHWSGGLTGTTNPATLMMNGPSTVIANYAEQQGQAIYLPIIKK